MTRETWLETQWKRYPSAGAGWLDVASFLKAPRASAIVCGRLISAAGQTFLEWGGQRLRFEFSPKLQWLLSNPTAAAPNTTWFREGDLIALKIETARDGQPVASAIELLSPAAVDQLQPPPSSFSVSRSREWASFLQTIRDFFTEKDFIEVQTPTLVPSPGTEPFLDPFTTKWELGSKTRTFYLPTSPEFHLKQLLAKGWSRIFELKPCFRNGEIGAHHQPEFLMLEWYRTFANLDAIADDVGGLLKSVGDKFSLPVPALERTTVADLFKNAYGGFVLKPDSTVDDLRELASANGISFDENDNFDDVFFRLFLERIEPHLGKNGPLLVSHYPPSQAALSRVGASGFAERFEIYWKGVELANAFHELNDPKENEKRFAIDAEKKAELGKESVPRDENLVKALRAGMPPSGGIALGVERLFMVLFGCQSIAETRAFPVSSDVLTRRD